MGPKRKATSPPGASPSAERGGAPNGNPKSAVGTADDDERSWATLAARVRAHGGVVHANVRVGADASGTRGLVAVGPIEEGATLFRIPGECTLTAASALRSPLGKAIAKRAAQKLVGAGSAPQDKRDGRTTDTYHLPSRSLPLGDIALAAFVAADGLDPNSPFAAYHALLRRTPLDDAPAWWPREQRDELLRGAFLGTRASRVSETLRRDAVDAFESLVREELLKHLRERKGRFRVPDAFDAWDAFRRALAAVHSRAFNFGELNDVFETGDSVCESERKERASDRSLSDFETFLSKSSMSRAREHLEREAAGSALVPLLDCANHYRKPRECAWRVSKADEKKKVASGSVSPEYALGGSEHLVVEVVALRFFVSGDPVRVAYGARSNEHLLTRYGFCVKDNVEPDGSSNDETPFFLSENGAAEVPGEIAVGRDRDGRDLDASIADGNRRVFLRVATKPEYTFAPFAAALDLFRARARERRDGKSAEQRVDDAFGRGPLSSAETVSAPLARDEEDFLGDFRGDGDGDEDDDDACAALMYGSGEEEEEEEEEEEDPGAVPYEKKTGEDALVLEALNDMALSLGDRAAKLARAAEETALCVPSGPGTRTDMCVTYLESEARTFLFFSRAASNAAREIAGGDGDDESPKTDYSYEDDEGVSALVAAFAELRRSNARLNAAIAKDFR
jgi:hypothetical protein